jgi:hypothetical protein
MDAPTLLAPANAAVGWEKNSLSKCNLFYPILERLATLKESLVVESAQGARLTVHGENYKEGQTAQGAGCTAQSNEMKKERSIPALWFLPCAGCLNHLHDFYRAP